MSGNPMAFFSYAHDDDAQNDGMVTSLYELLQSEVKGLSRKWSQIQIFKDRESIEWGDYWNVEMHIALKSAMLFIPVISPAYLDSAFCKDEFNTFLEKEQDLLSRMLNNYDIRSLIFPIIFHGQDDEFFNGENQSYIKDISERNILKALNERQYVDFRSHRISSRLRGTAAHLLIADLANKIVRLSKEFQQKTYNVKKELELPFITQLNEKIKYHMNQENSILYNLPFAQIWS